MRRTAGKWCLWSFVPTTATAHTNVHHEKKLSVYFLFLLDDIYLFVIRFTRAWTQIHGCIVYSLSLSFLVWLSFSLSLSRFLFSIPYNTRTLYYNIFVIFFSSTLEKHNLSKLAFFCPCLSLSLTLTRSPAIGIGGWHSLSVSWFVDILMKNATGIHSYSISTRSFVQSFYLFHFLCRCVFCHFCPPFFPCVETLEI